ncbi:MAG TPA: hypothetical protein DD671_17080, partial [Balneolaceae bacterium]|nr:hypothetical protein [Balneolaceae bacterium]
MGRAAKMWIATVAVAAFSALQRTAGRVASQFQDDFAQVKTLLNETEVDFEALERRLLNLSKIKAVPLSVLTPALYQTISSGITDVNEAMDVLSIASDAAIAG